MLHIFENQWFNCTFKLMCFILPQALYSLVWVTVQSTASCMSVSERCRGQLVKEEECLGKPFYEFQALWSP